MNENLKVNSKTSTLEFKRKHNKIVDSLISEKKVNELIDEKLQNSNTKIYKPEVLFSTSEDDTEFNVIIILGFGNFLKSLRWCSISLTDNVDFVFDMDLMSVGYPLERSEFDIDGGESSSTFYSSLELDEIYIQEDDDYYISLHGTFDENGEYYDELVALNLEDEEMTYDSMIIEKLFRRE